MLSWPDLIAVLLVCVTTVACFVIRSNHGADVEDLDAELEALRVLPERVDTLTRIVQDNALAVARLNKEQTGKAIAHMIPTATPRVRP